LSGGADFFTFRDSGFFSVETSGPLRLAGENSRFSGATGCFHAYERGRNPGRGRSWPETVAAGNPASVMIDAIIAESYNTMFARNHNIFVIIGRQ
jgi:hypothetical protein